MCVQRLDTILNVNMDMRIDVCLDTCIDMCMDMTCEPIEPVQHSQQVYADVYVHVCTYAPAVPSAVRMGPSNWTYGDGEAHWVITGS